MCGGQKVGYRELCFLDCSDDIPGLHMLILVKLYTLKFAQIIVYQLHFSTAT